MDEATITGEPVRIEKHAGESVIGGTVNGTGPLLIRAEKVDFETVLSRIIETIANAQRSRAPIQRVADTAAAYFEPAAVAVAATPAGPGDRGWCPRTKYHIVIR